MNSKLTLDDRAAGNGRRSAQLAVGGATTEIWFERDDDGLSAGCADSFVIAAMFACMRNGSDLRVAGPVSRVLLRNLGDWQAAWRLWNPTYRRIAIHADEVIDSATPSLPSVVTAFSGGLDSAYTANRHLAGRDHTRVRPQLTAAVLIHGADIPLADTTFFSGARTRAERMLAPQGVPLVVIRTNVRTLLPAWHDGHAAAIASCLTVLAPEFGEGLIPSSNDYGHLHFPYGTNPVTDHLVSTATMQLRTDGAGATRTEKAAAIAGWPEAMRWLRVCWQGAELDRNCGRCEKCIRTVLNFRAAGAELPACFDRDVTIDDIHNLRLGPSARSEMEPILSHCAQHGLNDPWVTALRAAVRRSRRRDVLLSPVRRRPTLARRIKTVRNSLSPPP